LKYHKIRELIKENEIDLKYIKSHYNLAVELTKYLNGPLKKDLKKFFLAKFNYIKLTR